MSLKPFLHRWVGKMANKKEKKYIGSMKKMLLIIFLYIFFIITYPDLGQICTCGRTELSL
ncbi:MAG: hypothetical protein A3J83_00380 [Elusimicrobia bacterium RIFOXYA2_FULL_40_6]|nr:MAG: hypothetical protein A3J83_00380 [Elusimicrobia bacterium RIFOXYA2_FULL_40_6]